MLPTTALLSDSVLRSALATGLDATPAAETLRLAGFIREAFGRSAAALIHYGSHAQRSDARSESERDFFVIVDDYDEAYRRFTTVVGTKFRAATAARLAKFLAPNALAVAMPGELPRRAKVVVFSVDDFALRCSAGSPDHFVQGRIFQYAQLVWCRDAISRSRVVEAVLEARARTFDWGRVFLPKSFDTYEFCRTLLRTSFAAEIRPESNNRVDVLLAAQRDVLTQMYAPLLAHLADRGVLWRQGGSYSDAAPPGPEARRRVRAFFARSKRRATMRWIKFVALYDDWLGYITQKIVRRTGSPIELTERERRYPLIFLWPRAVRFIFSRPQKKLLK